ncbi:MAG: DUF1931 domain-containing protein [Candidatus Heimdallarchaeota archaeon]|nr:DUF1931 domain-containing protein [Candidatus Heimdallarchaeota archaeon]
MAKKKAKKAKSSGEILVVQSKVREYLKGQGDYNIGSDLVGAVSGRVEEVLQSAAKRAKDNGRKTIQARDV